jgi:excisionase family DNA binding protein
MYLMTIDELADYLGESKRTIYRYIQSGDCPPYIRITKKNIKFDKRDVDAWLESKKVRPQKIAEAGSPTCSENTLGCPQEGD